MHGRAIPPLWIPALRGRKDFHSAPAYRSLFYAFDTTRPPFDNALDAVCIPHGHEQERDRTVPRRRTDAGTDGGPSVRGISRVSRRFRSRPAGGSGIFPPMIRNPLAS